MTIVLSRCSRVAGSVVVGGWAGSMLMMAEAKALALRRVVRMVGRCMVSCSWRCCDMMFGFVCEFVDLGIYECW